MPDITTVYAYRCDLTSGARCIELPTPLMYRDAYADVFCVTVLRGDAPVDLTGAAVTGRMHFLATGQTVEVDGSVQTADSSASVVLSPDCYALPGRFMLSMQLMLGTVKHTVLCLTGMLTRTYSDNTTLPATGGASGSTPGTTIDLSSFIDDDVSSTATSSIKAWSSRKAQAMLDEKLQGTGGADLTGAVRYDEAQNLSDAQKAQARANIGVTSTGADISGIIDDTTTAADKAWSSSKTATQISAAMEVWNVDYEDLSGKIGEPTELNTTTKTDIVSAINEVNSKVGSGTGTGSGAVISDTTTSSTTTWSSSKITQAINDAAAGETLPTDPLRIECWGDSLTLGAGTTDANEDGYSDYDTHSYPALLEDAIQEKMPDMTVKNYGVGSENCETILARMGATPMYVHDITIPASGVVLISRGKLRSATGAEVSPLRQVANKDKGVNNVTIAGIEGELTLFNLKEDGSDWEYYFQRTTPGTEELVITTPVKVVTSYMKTSNDNRVRVIWMGQNDITDADMSGDMAQLGQHIIEACRAAIRDVDKYIILTAPVSTGATAAPYKPIHRAMVNAFGDHCINIVDYLIRYGLTDAGVTATTQDTADMAAYYIPSSLRSDLVHLNGTGYSIVADQVYKRGQELGYWT